MTYKTDKTFDEETWARQRDRERSGAAVQENEEAFFVDELAIFEDKSPELSPLFFCSLASFLVLILSTLLFNSLAGKVEEYKELERLYIYKLRIYEGDKLSYLQKRLAGAARKEDAILWRPPFEDNFRKIIRKSIRYTN